jgi:GAF domain-containing protein
MSGKGAELLLKTHQPTCLSPYQVPTFRRMMLVPELERLNALKEYHILDSLPEASYDNIVKLAAQICNVPIAAITFVDSDRLWIKSSVGIDFKEIPRAISMCAEAILHDAPLVVEDATQEPKFQNNPLVTADGGLRFYAGIRLVSKEGHAVGAICVCDTTIRTIDEEQLTMLRSLAGLVSRQLEVRRLVFRTKAQTQRLISQFKEHSGLAGGTAISAITGR